jgi:hypothetical protein
MNDGGSFGVRREMLLMHMLAAPLFPPSIPKTTNCRHRLDYNSADRMQR